MKRGFNKTQKNYIIGSLIAIVLIMTVAFAAFSTSLNIQGTSKVDSKWDVEITGISLQEKSGSTVNEGTPTFTNLTATFNTSLTRPGDYAIYKIEITNKGTLNAIINTLPTITNSNKDITFYLNKDEEGNDLTEVDRILSATDILNASGDTNNLDKGYVYLTVVYNDYEGQVSPSEANKTVNKTLTFDFEQTTDSAVVTPTAPILTAYYGKECTSIGETLDTTQWSTSAPSGEIIYLKQEVDSENTVVNSYVCIVAGGNEYCLQGGRDSDDNAYYSANQDEIRKAKTNYFDTVSGDTCAFGDSYSYCYGGGFLDFDAYSDGRVDADVTSGAGCRVFDSGNSLCD